MRHVVRNPAISRMVNEVLGFVDEIARQTLDVTDKVSVFDEVFRIVI